MTDKLDLLLADGVIDEVLGRLKSGKEANISLVRRGDLVLAAKVYKDRSTRSFKNNSDYKEGRKVRNSRTQRAMDSGGKFGRDAAEQEWKSAEADALYKLSGSGVRVPEPVMFYEGVLLMEVVHDAEGQTAPRLIDVPIDPDAALGIYADLVAQMISMLCCDLIHGDLSPYNILAAADGPTIIDFPQVVSAVHSSRAEYFFLRDFDNVVRFLAGFDPSLSVHTADGRAIWRAYVSRELTPQFVPPPPPPPRATRGPDRRSRPDERGRSGRPPQGNGGRPQGNGGRGRDDRPPPRDSGRPPQNSGGRPPQNNGSRPPQNNGSRPQYEAAKNSGDRPQYEASQNSGSRPQYEARPPQNNDARPPQNSGERGRDDRQPQRFDGRPNNGGSPPQNNDARPPQNRDARPLQSSGDRGRDDRQPVNNGDRPQYEARPQLNDGDRGRNDRGPSRFDGRGQNDRGGQPQNNGDRPQQSNASSGRGAPTPSSATPSSNSREYVIELRDDEFDNRPQSAAARPAQNTGDRPQQNDGDRARDDRAPQLFEGRIRRHNVDRGRDAGPQQSNGDRPQQSSGDRSPPSSGDRPRNDGPQREGRGPTNNGDRPRSDGPQRFDGRGQQNHGDRPPQNNGDRPRNDGPQRFDGRGQQNNGNRPPQNSNNRPPQRTTSNDRPPPRFDARPAPKKGGPVPGGAGWHTPAKPPSGGRRRPKRRS